MVCFGSPSDSREWNNNKRAKKLANSKKRELYGKDSLSPQKYCFLKMQNFSPLLLKDYRSFFKNHFSKLKKKLTQITWYHFKKAKNHTLISFTLLG